MTEETTTQAEDLRAETAEAAPEVAKHDQQLGRVAELEQQLAEAKQATLYARAEGENIRRRAEKEAADARAYAVTSFARDILSVADNLQRGLQAIPADAREEPRFKGLLTGLEATGRELDKVLERHGITRIAAMGEALDPNRHQAMLEVEHDEAEPGTIIQELQAGYTIKDRLLRPSLVSVAKAKG